MRTRVLKQSSPGATVEKLSRVLSRISLHPLSAISGTSERTSFGQIPSNSMPAIMAGLSNAIHVITQGCPGYPKAARRRFEVDETLRLGLWMPMPSSVALPDLPMWRRLGGPGENHPPPHRRGLGVPEHRAFTRGGRGTGDAGSRRTPGSTTAWAPHQIVQPRWPCLMSPTTRICSSGPLARLSLLGTRPLIGANLGVSVSPHGMPLRRMAARRSSHGASPRHN